MPLAAKEHVDLRLLGRRRRVSLPHVKPLGYLRQEDIGGHPVELLYYSVVRQDLKLISWEQHREEEVVFFISVVIRVLTQFRTCAAGARRPVVAVGDIQQGNGLERLDEQVSISIRNAPDRMRYTIRCYEIVERILLLCSKNEVVDLLSAAVGQKHRTGLRAKGKHMPRTVIFFVFTGALVFTNYVRVIFIY